MWMDKGRARRRIVAAGLGSNLAMVMVAPVLAQQVDSAQPSADEAGIGDIVVTAQKQSQRLLDVPNPITALSGNALETRGVSTLSDLTGFVPGLSMQNGGAPGARTIVLRGLSTGYAPQTGSPLAAVYLDDVAVGAALGVRSAQFGLDLLPFDIDRIEVLKGPQGTLYGAGAMGGIIKYVLKKPSLTESEGRVGGGVEITSGTGGDLSWTGRAAVSVPLVTDRLGVRISGVYKKDAGYLDNIGTGGKDVNRAKTYGGRVTLLWKPTETLSVQGSLLYQKVGVPDRQGVAVYYPSGNLYAGARDAYTVVAQPYSQKTTFASLEVNWDLGFANLVSATSWSKVQSSFTTDLTYYAQAFYTGRADVYGYSALTDFAENFTQEARLNSPAGQKFQWRVGALYTRGSPKENYNLPVYDLNRVEVDDFFAFETTFARFEEQAAFGSLAYRLGAFNFQVGGRISHNRDKSATHNYGFYNPVDTTATSGGWRPAEKSWMITGDYHFDKNHMVYARVATGYRPGSGCTGCGIALPGGGRTPDFVKTDKLINYEIGFKGGIIPRTYLDISAFLIDWSDIQSTVLSGGVAYSGNGNAARVKGVESSLSYTGGGLDVTATLAYIDAYLTQDAPGISGVKGDPLPMAAKWSGSVSADYSYPISAQTDLRIGGSYRYQSAVHSDFSLVFDDVRLKRQSLLEAYIGAKKGNLFGKVYARNLLNDKSYAGRVFTATPTTTGLVPNQPLTVGVSLDLDF